MATDVLFANGLTLAFIYALFRTECEREDRALRVDRSIRQALWVHRQRLSSRDSTYRPRNPAQEAGFFLWAALEKDNCYICSNK